MMGSIVWRLAVSMSLFSVLKRHFSGVMRYLGEKMIIYLLVFSV